MNNTSVLDLVAEYIFREGERVGGDREIDDNKMPGSDRYITNRSTYDYDLSRGKLTFTLEDTIKEVAYGTQEPRHSYELVRTVKIVSNSTLIVDATKSYGGIEIHASFFGVEQRYLPPKEWEIRQSIPNEDLVKLMADQYIPILKG